MDRTDVEAEVYAAYIQDLKRTAIAFPAYWSTLQLGGSSRPGEAA
jgi:hypothetical protein